ncbi:MFS transporter [Caldalkalibacillus salinus]|uniref:MFS transporter n=1 Tax=Caldalkalibacillus salinus TaxID=2803787 RepID=UPI001F1C58A1|nr:MFS transporter [Caldalkalibacillus salinus]
MVSPHNQTTKNVQFNPREKRLIQLLCIMIPFSAMNIMMFNVALADISREFDVSLSATSWVVTIFGMIYAIGALVYGKLADLYGIRKLTLFGIIFFSIGSIVGLASQHFYLLIVSRLLQGIGASSIPTLSMLIPIRFVKAERRGRALGIVSAVLAFSGAVGPIIGGFIVGAWHWKALFVFSLANILTLPLAYRWLPTEDLKKTTKLNYVAAALLVITIVSFMLSITMLNIVPLLISMCALFLFITQQKRSSSPLIPLKLFRNRDYLRGLLMGAINAAVNFGVLIITPLLFSQVYKLNETRIGLLLFPGAMSAALLGYFGGKMIDRKGNRFVMSLAIFLISSGLIALSSISGYSAIGVAVCLVFTSVGYIFMQPTLVNWVSSTMNSHVSGIGMGVYSLNNFLSTAISGAVASTLLDQISGIPVNPLAPFGGSGVYSNVYLLFFALTLVNLVLLYHWMYRNGHNENIKGGIHS